MTIAAGLYLLLLCGHILLPAVEPFALFLAVAMCAATVVVVHLQSSGKRYAICSEFGLHASQRFADLAESDVLEFAEHTEFYCAELQQLEVELAVLEDQLHCDAVALNIPLAAGINMQSGPDSRAAAD